MQVNRPDYGVYARLGASSIHGVGVFAIRDIPQGTYPFLGEDGPFVRIDQSEVETFDEEAKRLYFDFCALEDGVYICPSNFNQLTVTWYMNDPGEGHAPNIGCDKDLKFYAMRDIKKGEELTVDYSQFSQQGRTDTTTTLAE